MEPENVKFMDSVIYTILLDEFDNIKDVINHSNNNISDELRKDLGNSILKDKDIKDRYIGSLYSKDYFYSYKKGNVLVIYDNNNGGDVTLNLTKQDADGNIVIDSISTLVMNMKNNSTFTGVINSANEAKSIVLNLDATSKIKLEGDCYISELNNKDSSNSNIDFNGYKLYVNGKEVK